MYDMNQLHYRIHELAKKSGLNARLIRSYISKGLLDGPVIPGRNAYYEPRHLSRLQAIKVLRDLDGLGLDEIRRRLVGRTETEIEEVARRIAPDPDTEENSALDYVRELQRQRATARTGTSELAAAIPDDDDVSGDLHASARHRRLLRRHTEVNAPIEERRTNLFSKEHPQAFGQAILPQERHTLKRPRAETMLRIPINPDTDIVVRGGLETSQVRQLEYWAERIRNSLLGQDMEDA